MHAIIRRLVANILYTKLTLQYEFSMHFDVLPPAPLIISATAFLITKSHPTLTSPTVVTALKYEVSSKALSCNSVLKVYDEVDFRWNLLSTSLLCSCCGTFIFWSCKPVTKEMVACYVFGSPYMSPKLQTRINVFKFTHLYTDKH